MIAHSTVSLTDWPAVEAELATSGLTYSVHRNHIPLRICIESHSLADAATVQEIITNAGHRQTMAARNALKKQLMTHRRTTPCRTKQSS